MYEKAQAGSRRRSTNGTSSNGDGAGEGEEEVVDAEVVDEK